MGNIEAWNSWYTGFFLKHLFDTEDSLMQSFGNTDNIMTATFPEHVDCMRGARKIKKAHKLAICQSSLAIELQNPKERFRDKIVM